ncbi:hypothetical protein FF1_036629 [Malus domestica]
MRTAAHVINRLPQPSHLRSKFDKNAIRYIFVGYDSQRKWWKCCDSNTGRCYTSRDMVFDEASSWWSSEKEALPNSREIEDKLQQKIGSKLFESSRDQMSLRIHFMVMVLSKQCPKTLSKLGYINNQKKIDLVKWKYQLHNHN